VTTAYEQALADIRSIPTTKPVPVLAAPGNGATRTQQPGKRRGNGHPRTEPKCGTYSGYQAHHQRGEDPCWACRDARRERDRAYYAEHREQVLARRRAGGA